MKGRGLGLCVFLFLFFDVQIATKGGGDTPLANILMLSSSSERGGYHTMLEELGLLKPKALVYQVNRPGR